MVESRGDDTLRPGSLGSQLIHLLAGVQTVFTRVHPVIGGCRDHDAQPAEAADEKTAQLKTRVRHDANCAQRPLVQKTVRKFKARVESD